MYTIELTRAAILDFVQILLFLVIRRLEDVAIGLLVICVIGDRVVVENTASAVQPMSITAGRFEITKHATPRIIIEADCCPLPYHVPFVHTRLAINCTVLSALLNRLILCVVVRLVVVRPRRLHSNDGSWRGKIN